MVFYNDHDAFVCAWLRELIGVGAIPEGRIDGRSVLEVVSADLGSFRQCHFFVGVGGWPRALELAGWPLSREVWTASLPCQPFSVAGRGRGDADERHLWPAFHRLVAERRPATIFGEQVAGADGREWFAGVRADLEGAGYACGAAIMPACAVGAPHRRERLFWVADAGSGRIRGGGSAGDFGAAGADQGDPRQWQRLWPDDWSGGGAGLVADAEGRRRSTDAGAISGDAPSAAGSREPTGGDHEPSGCGKGERMGDAVGQTRRRTAGVPESNDSDGAPRLRTVEPGRSNSGGFWSDAVWLAWADGKSRRVKPGVRLLADGVPNRVGRLRGYGNAIVAPLAAEFVKAFMEA